MTLYRYVEMGNEEGDFLHHINRQSRAGSQGAPADIWRKNKTHLAETLVPNYLKEFSFESNKTASTIQLPLLK